MQLKETLRAKFEGLKKYYVTFFKWLLLSIIIGGVCGVVGTIFFYCVSVATDVRQTYPWLIYFLPVAGLFIAFIYSKADLKNDRGTNLVITSIRSQDKVPLRMVPLIFISTTLTHLFGGSAGREGAALQIGGGIGTQFAKRIGLSEREMSVATMCGMSAVFSALFGTPLTAAVFSMEVVSVGLMHYSAFVPCLFSSILAYEIAKFAKVEFETFVISQIPMETIATFWKVIVVGLIVAMVGVIFCMLMHKSGKILRSIIKNRYILAVIGGVSIIILTKLLGTYDYNGAGSHIIEHAVAGDAVWYAFIIKMIFTAITLGCGYKGGEIVPTFFIGATLGCVIAPIIGLPPGFCAALGLIGMFCAVVNCPIASILLSVELFGANRIMLFAIVCVVSYMMSGTYSLYSGQKIVYSKLEPEFINRDAR